MQTPLAAFEEHLSSANRHTAANYLRAARGFFEHLERAAADGAAPSPAHVDSFLARMRPGGSPASAATKNLERAALSALAKHLVSRGGWSSDPTEDTDYFDVPPRDPAVLSLEETGLVLRASMASGEPWERIRNGALVGVLTQTGLRVSEAAGLNAAQVDPGAALLRSVKGKGGRVDNVPLNAVASGLLADWFRHRGEVVEPGEGALFVSSRRTRISVRTVERLVGRLASSLPVPRRLYPHLFRHSFATNLLVLGVDLYTCSRLLRHADIRVTARFYIHLADHRHHDAAALFGASMPAELLAPPCLNDQQEPLDAQRALYGIASHWLAA